MPSPLYTHFPWGPPGARRLVFALPPASEGAPCRAQHTDDSGATWFTRFFHSVDHKGPRSLLWTGSSVVAGFRGNEVEYSGDGALSWARSLWTSQPPQNAEWRGAAEGANVVVLAADDVVAASSTFGSTFTALPLATGRVAGVVYHNGQFQLFTQLGRRFTSPDGFTWSAPTSIDIASTWTFWPPNLELQTPVQSHVGLLASAFVSTAGQVGLFASGDGGSWTQ